MKGWIAGSLMLLGTGFAMTSCVEDEKAPTTDTEIETDAAAWTYIDTPGSGGVYMQCVPGYPIRVSIHTTTGYGGLKDQSITYDPTCVAS